MRYWLEFHEATVVPYLLGLPMSREARITLAAFFDELRSHADAYIQSPERRLAPGSDCFLVDYVFRDPVSRRTHRLKLVVSDAAAQYGVLRVVCAEQETYP
jgi:hypothetical protein